MPFILGMVELQREGAPFCDVVVFFGVVSLGLAVWSAWKLHHELARGLAIAGILITWLIGLLGASAGLAEYVAATFAAPADMARELTMQSLNLAASTTAWGSFLAILGILIFMVGFVRRTLAARPQ